MYNGGGGQRPPTGQMPEMRYANSGSPRPLTGAARPGTAGTYQEPYPTAPGPYSRPATQGSQIPPSSSPSNLQPQYDYEDVGHPTRPAMPAAVYDRPSYSRGNSPAPYGYNESQEDFHRPNYPSEETYPLTAYQRPMTPGTPGDYGFEGDTGNASYYIRKERSNFSADFYTQRPTYFQNPNVVDDPHGPNTNFAPYDEGPNVRRGEPPPRQPRRFKTVKRVELFQGNLVLDCPVPPRFLNTLPNKKDREFTHMRYTAATCDPADFKKEKFTLRQVLYEQPRQTELFIVITLYNEDEVLFARTMHGVMKNISHLCSRERSKVWGREGWRKVVVCVVADGRTKIHTRTLAMLAAMGVYQDGVAKNAVNGKPVSAHIFEYTTQISIDPSLQFRGAEKGIMPCQMIFCLKEKNQKKINSHRWFFQAFGPILQPNICVLLDGGTRPGGDSLYHLWKAFDLNSNIAGACGEIVAMKGPFGRNLLNPLVAAQNFEYKMSNILDKPLESVFGFISVLPGAFSAYRYIALQNDHLGQGPLASYFKGEKLHGAGAGIFEANMYLAEDRILCFELVAKRKASWVLHYVKSAYAETDVPDRLPELISQRRRWLNGSFFAAVYAISHAFAVFRTDHSLLRKLLFQVEFLYQTINMIFSWFALGNFFLIFVILTSSMGDADVSFPPGKILFMVFEYIYIALLLMCFVLSMGNRPQGSKFSYMATALFFAALMGYMLFCSAWLTVKGVQATLAKLHAEGQRFGESFSETVKAIFQNPIFFDLVVSTASTYGLYLFSSLLFFDFLHMFTSFIQYLLLSPSYVNILNVYAFCNTHDVSWGTKGDNSMKTDLGVVKVGDDNKVEVNVPSKDEDIDLEYDRVLKILAKPRTEEKQKRDANTKQEDYYKSFRTRVVLVWIITNLALIIGVLHSNSGVQGITVGTTNNGSESSASIYLTVILWSVAGLAAFRFIGSLLYLIFRLFQGE